MGVSLGEMHQQNPKIHRLIHMLRWRLVTVEAFIPCKGLPAYISTLEQQSSDVISATCLACSRTTARKIKM